MGIWEYILYPRCILEGVGGGGTPYSSDGDD